MSEDELTKVKPEFMGFHKGDYPGAFPPKVERKIRTIVSSPCLHLFSGSSTIGDVRVDLSHPNATLNEDVYRYITEDFENDNSWWKWVILDPVYNLENKHLQSKLRAYAKVESWSGNILYLRALEIFFQRHTENILWFDTCSPQTPGFERHKVWFYIMGGYNAIRALTWLKRKGERLI